ncbi:M1 family metallopeptidase [Rubinisphaera brasiliensis]|uniref:Peptidase M1 membrane alanine aminopeptidase n=1 Tax=Rubinisphaera brasiliensis (strain ATCC 49424 / DSM 5305 / JCM 21570 / IAM 15109 / NBRC 103401 / IFAM 1448) TaxID=756272 RepID=F0SRZ1_RUBBR|nr:M1 family metallopeptidase [Rubinisphaera brasiliensis]ADY61329.1 Peptidase M1 membrane alanine aminopeptidase [Rubinisphaera brasiliensis DSM 5305]
MAENFRRLTSPAFPFRDLPLLMLLATLLSLTSLPSVQLHAADEGNDPFAQIDDRLPTATAMRLATGAPGPEYWQQRADYQIDVTLDERRKRILGKARIHYENHSPHELTYLWLQLDANRFTPTSDRTLSSVVTTGDTLTVDSLQRLLATDFDGGVKLNAVVDQAGKPLDHTVVKGMLRIDLPAPLPSGDSVDFGIDWEYAINNTKLVAGRTGFELFDDGNAIFCIAQWFPRLCAYTDYGGWRHKQFLRRGEFTLEFGNYDVKISAPGDHILLATGELQNADEVLTETQQQRLDQALASDEPVFIVTQEEAENTSANPSDEEYKTWHFRAENVRDFAFASSRRFLWDACGQSVGDRRVLCMSLYPKEGMPLWDQYSTHAIAHTVEVYSRVTGIDYPYPHATAVMGVVGGGMEYPMICFNGPRPEKDGSYSERTKERVIGVIIHEVGHNWFPMIINNDERHWMWLDEGFNSFVQSIAQREWDRNPKHSRAEPRSNVGYLTRDKQRPIMTHPDSVYDISSNAYSKPSAGLTILRETILGRELFDFAFRQYCGRWAYKRPQPSDFFRSMEDASGIDLDWYWNGWYYTTDSCDFDIVSIVKKNLHDGNPEQDQHREDKKKGTEFPDRIRELEVDQPRRIDKYETLRDFYDDYDPHALTEKKATTYKEFLERLTDEERETLADLENLHVYQVKIRNHGDLVMPLILKLTFADGESEIRRYPAEIWRKSPDEIETLLRTDKPLTSITADPYHETADTDLSNNVFPRPITEADVQITKPKPSIDNPLHESMKKDKK